jgi:hypothetical protein
MLDPGDCTDHLHERPSWFTPILPFLPAAAAFVFHLATARGWGFHSDEFYYIACSEHLAWGYVDHPSLSIFLLWFERALLGDSIVAIRFLPAVASAVTVALTTLLARRLGAALFGQLLAGVCALAAPLYLAIGHYYSMNAYDLVIWAAAFYFLVRVFDGDNPRQWLWFGVVVGIGLENKISLLFLGAGVAAGLLVTRHRRHLLTPWPWLGATIALLLFVPHLLWQVQNGWPTVEFIRRATTVKMAGMSLGNYLLEQVTLMLPFALPVWVAGLGGLLFHPALRRFRALGICYLTVLGIFVTLGGKTYYLGVCYSVLFAGGGVLWERWLAGRVLRVIAVTVLLAGGVLGAVSTIPILPVETFLRMSAALGSEPSAGGERHAVGRLSSFHAAMFGWENLVATVARVYHDLPPQDQARAGIYCQDYHQAGAIDFLGRPLGLPRAMSGHNTYWLWGPQGPGEVVIVLGGRREDTERVFEHVAQVAIIHDARGLSQPSEDNIPVYVARGPKLPIADVWPTVKHYD